MSKVPVRVSLNNKQIFYGNQSHIVGEHLSTFVNIDYNLFKAVKDPVYSMDDSYLINDEATFETIHNFFKELFYVCFSSSFLIDQGIKPEHTKQANKLFTPQRRYLYFLKKHKDFVAELSISYEMDFNWYSSNWRSSLSPQHDASKLVSILDKDLTELDAELISVLHSEPTYIEHVSVPNFQSFLFYEFNKIIQLDIPIKQCENCGFYFVPKGRPDSLYCDNIYSDSGKTCREIGAANVYKEKINENDVHRIFSRYYKKMYARQTNKKISKEDFLNWSNAAREERDKAVRNNLSAKAFTKIIEKLEK